MIDIENEVFTQVATALCEQFPKITVESVTTYSPSKFPFVCIEEADNYSYQPSRDSGSNENHATVMYEVNAYSNKTNGKKAECKAIISVVDDIMIGLGFTRNTKKPISFDNATKYRIFARYSAVASKTHSLYRR